jgi:DNA-binding NtrC family response regulator
MAESILSGKRILAVDDEPDVLGVLQEEIRDAVPNCTVEKVTTYEVAAKKLKEETYDLVILDIMGVRGFDLLDLAVGRDFKVVMFTAHAVNPEALDRSFKMKARAYLPKEKLGEIVPFLEDVLTHDFSSGWKVLLGKLEEFINRKFGSDTMPRYFE